MPKTIEHALLPRPTPISKPFWTALANEQVQLQRCDDCAQWVFYPRPHCPNCLSDRLQWHSVSGNGHLYSFTINRIPLKFALPGRSSNILAVVELDEGVHIMSCLLDTENTPIVIGMRLSPVFDQAGAGLVLLKHRPAGATSS